MVVLFASLPQELVFCWHFLRASAERQTWRSSTLCGFLFCVWSTHWVNCSFNLPIPLIKQVIWPHLSSQFYSKPRDNVWLTGNFEIPKHHNIDMDRLLINEFGHKFLMYICDICAYIHLPVYSSLFYLKMNWGQPWARKLQSWNFGDLIWNGFCYIHC